MWLIKLLYSQVLVAFLLFCYALKPAFAANMAQLKNQQHALGQTATSSAEQHPQQVSTQTQHQLHQQTQQSGGVGAHPVNRLDSNANSVQHEPGAGHHSLDAQGFPPSLQSADSSQTAATLAHLPSPQYLVHDKEMAMQEIIKHFNTNAYFNDQYQLLNEFKRGTQNSMQHTPSAPFVSLHSPPNMAYPWNLYDRSYAAFASLHTSLPQMAGLLTHNFNPFGAYSTPYPVTPRFLPIMSYPQPVYVPYPFVMPPDMVYPTYSNLPQMANDYEDSMSRGAGSARRPVPSQHSSGLPRNSPIFYVRLPPTPYMLLPGLGLGSSPSGMTNFPNLIPYQSLPSFPSFSSIFNVPINFLANGKPTNIYQMGAPPNDIQNPLQFSNIPTNFNIREPSSSSLTNAYRPPTSSHNYFNSASSLYASYPGSPTGSESSSSTATLGTAASLSHHDSKLTALKHPYFFNGRPEDIYILPNNFNPLYSSESSYY